MISGTAGHDVDPVQIFQKVFCKSHLGKINPSVFHICAHSVLNRFRLFVDLFEHEMLISAFFRGFRVPFDLHHIFPDLFPVNIIEVDFIL